LDRVAVVPGATVQGAFAYRTVVETFPKAVTATLASAVLVSNCGSRLPGNEPKGDASGLPISWPSGRVRHLVPVFGISITFGFGRSLKAAFRTAVNLSRRSGT